MKIYTKAGDRGQTGLLGGGRASKDHPRIEAFGSVDELNSMLGLARAEGLPAAQDAVVARVQAELFDLGAELAAEDPSRHPGHIITSVQISQLEDDIDRFDQSLPALRHFILPGGSRAAAAVHIARAVCRRAERRVVHLAAMSDQRVSPHVIVYLNRLGDLLFVIARAVNAAVGQADVLWKNPDDASAGRGA